MGVSELCSGTWWWRGKPGVQGLGPQQSSRSCCNATGDQAGERIFYLMTTQGAGFYEADSVSGYGHAQTFAGARPIG